MSLVIVHLLFTNVFSIVNIFKERVSRTPKCVWCHSIFYGEKMPRTKMTSKKIYLEKAWFFSRANKKTSHFVKTQALIFWIIYFFALSPFKYEWQIILQFFALLCTQKGGFNLSRKSVFLLLLIFVFPSKTCFGTKKGEKAEKT